MQEKIIDKLRKLLAHKESAEKIGSIQEAEAFAARISKLLSDYKLEMSNISSNQEVEENIEREFVDLESLGIPQTMRKDNLLVTLANIIAKANFCLAVSLPKSNRFYLIGKKTDKQIALYIFHLLYRASRDMAEAEYRREYYKYKIRGEEDKMKGFKKSYLHGFNLAIHERLRKQEVERTQEEGLILKSELDKVIKWTNQHMKLKNVKSNLNLSNEAAKNKGYAYGKSVAINRAVNSSGQSAKMLK